MSPDTIVIGTGIVLAGLIVPTLRELRRDMAGIHRDIADLRECMARLEGLFEGVHPPRASRTGDRHDMMWTRTIALIAAIVIGASSSPSPSVPGTFRLR